MAHSIFNTLASDHFRKFTFFFLQTLLSIYNIIVLVVYNAVCNSKPHDFAHIAFFIIQLW